MDLRYKVGTVRRTDNQLDWIEYDDRRKIIKYYPLFDWSYEEVRDFAVKILYLIISCMTKDLSASDVSHAHVQ